MPIRIAWTDTLDADLIAKRRSGASWDLIANALGVGRNAVIDRGRRVGAVLPSGDRARAAEIGVDEDAADDPERMALPAGHQRAWSILTDGTLLEGTVFCRQPQESPSEPRPRAAAGRIDYCFGSEHGAALPS